MERIEKIRLAFLQSLIQFGYYEKEDLLVVVRPLGIPTLVFERSPNLPALQRTTLTSTLKDDFTANIDYFAVSPPYRGKNLGTELYSMFELACISEGINRITLEANGPAQIRFWTANGFYQTKTNNYQKRLT